MAFSIPELTPDDRPWRIDWFGEVTYQSRFQRRSQPVYKVFLSPVQEVKLGGIVTTEIIVRQHEVWLPIGTLPMLGIGDVWQHGERVTDPDHQQESFSVLVNSHTSHFVKAGLSLDKQFLLPMREHPWHRSATQSYCVCVTMKDGRRIIIPCVELIRFYFGSTSNLLHKLFTGPLTEEKLWREKSFDPATEHLHIKLASKISAASASDVGRIAMSAEAWRSAAGIYLSCVDAASQKSPVYPYMGFPFIGQTVFQASGKWLSFADKPQSTFVVFQLHSCSHKFPFKSLSYEVDASLGQKFTRKKKEGESDRKETKAHKSKSDKLTLSEYDPDARKSSTTLPIFRKSKFPDLNKKPVWLEKIDTSNASGVFMKHADRSIEQLAFGEGSYGGQGRETDMVSTYEQQVFDFSKFALPGFVKCGAKMVATEESRKGKEVVTRVIVMPGFTEPVFSLPRLVDEDGVVDPITDCCNEDKSIRQRRACFLRIENSDGKFVRSVIVIEAPKMAMLPVVAAISKIDLMAVIKVLYPDQDS